ncbi:DNA repair protein Nse1 [Xylona heveae TC161]|uniref:Non-structural maintenance of chromosomes element 1 homolog n=1 Tax=Xylona heveae (strain CBS 132557 / TC161) TaxID=1328760 RepID=A0A165FQ74_XYLHT|nr:DNA repair protein Nse1 [Xylona heveae TC161]KZF21247.1 DNA repair protein Nse1 [Xylona heveae TC161]
MMSDETSGQYNDGNRAFLQAFLARGVLTLAEAKPVLAAIFTVHEDRETLPEDVTEADFNSYIAAANYAISPFDFEIRSTLSQIDRTRIFALVNTTSDPMTQLATTYNADEISYLKRILDAMFETFNTPRREIMAITSMQALQLNKVPTDRARRESQNGNATQGSSGQSLTMLQAEKMLKQLVAEGWFEKSVAGFYSLSPRALIELRGWLMETYNDVGEEDDEGGEPSQRIKTCFACKDIVTVGQRCSERSCPVRLHDICTQNFFRAQQATNCPQCKREWTGNNYVGERAVTTTEEYMRGRRRSGPAAQAQPSTQRVGESEDDEEEE